MGTTFLGLTVPDLALRNIGGTKVTTAVVDSGVEGPRSLERWGRAGCALARDDARKEDGGDEGGEGAHLYQDW
jgi:hypothetical protein